MSEDKLVLNEKNMLQFLGEYKNKQKIPYLYGKATLAEGFYLTFVTEKEANSVNGIGVNKEISLDEMRDLSQSKHCKNKELILKMFKFVDEMKKMNKM